MPKSQQYAPNQDKEGGFKKKRKKEEITLYMKNLYLNQAHIM